MLESAFRGVSAPGGSAPALGGGGVSQHALRQTPPPVDRHTLVKILPWPNFVAAGNERKYRNRYFSDMASVTII